MALWQKLTALFRGRTTKPTQDALPKSRTVSQLPSPEYQPDDAEQVMAYARRLTPLTDQPVSCPPEILAALQRLTQSGQVAQAISLGGLLTSALPTDAVLQLAVAELWAKQQNFEAAVPLLKRVLQEAKPPPKPEQRHRARFLLHEAAQQRGDSSESLRQLTALLAEDFFYPGARRALDALLHSHAPTSAMRATEAPQLTERPPPLLTMTPTLVADRSPNDDSAARYQLIRELGSGGTGTVFLAFDTELACEVAAKVFHPRLRTHYQEQTLRRALHEAQLLAAVRHPGIIALLAVVQDAVPSDSQQQPGLPMLVMELCRGGSLSSRLRAEPLPAPVALLRFAELLETLTTLHQLGIVHGDIKPENLLFRGTHSHRYPLPAHEAQLGDLVLSDFGLGRLRDEPHARSEDALGTFGYLSPERLHGAPLTPEADLFSAGVLLLEMLCGSLQRTRSDALSQQSPLSQVAPKRLAQVETQLGAKWPMLLLLLQGLLANDPGLRPTAQAAWLLLQEPGMLPPSNAHISADES